MRISDWSSDVCSSDLCLLLGRPMVVAYRGAALTAWLLLSAGMLKTPHVSLPNLLSDEAVVPELLQQQATPEALAATLLPLLESDVARTRQLQQFDRVCVRLRCGAARQAAEAIATLLENQA